jgi:serine/threonine protein kinase
MLKDNLEMIKNDFKFLKETYIKQSKINKSKRIDIINRSLGEYFILTKLQKTSEYFAKPSYITQPCINSHIFDLRLSLEKYEISLENFVNQGFTFNTFEMRKFFLQLIRAYSILFTKKIVHSDVHPGNILISKQGNIKLCDFEDAYVYEKDINQEELPYNSPINNVNKNFLAPELYYWASNTELGNSMKYDPFKSDLFSLGLCILFANKISIKGLNIYGEKTLAVASRYFTETKKKLGNFHYKFFLESLAELQKKIDNAIESIRDKGLCSILKKMMNVNISERLCVEDILKSAETLSRIIRKI